MNFYLDIKVDRTVLYISHMLISFQMDIDSALLLYHGRVLRLVRV